jgi:hypothetical protein
MPPILNEIKVTQLPAKTIYLLGEVPDFTGLLVKKLYDNGAEELTEAYSTQWDTFTSGASTVTVNEDGKSASFVITVENTLVETGLPVIYIDTQNAQVITSKETYLTAGIKIIDSADSVNNIDTTTGIRGRGNSTWSYPKKPYRLKFESKISLFGYERAKSWVLLANYLDPTLIMNTVTFELGQRFDLPYTNHYIHVDLVLNGVYQGNYVLTEQMQVGAGRVDIDEDVDFMLINELVRNGELGHPKSTYMYKDKDATDKISMGPLWDFDWAFGYTGVGHTYFTNPETRLFQQGYTGSTIGTRFFGRFLDDPVFCAQYKERWNNHDADMNSIGVFIDTHLHNQINQY